MKNKNYGHPRFYELIKEEEELHSKKNYQYASDKDPLGNFNRVGRLCKKVMENKDLPDNIKIGLVNMAKQIDAVYDILGEGKENTIESVTDKLRDISVYSKIIMIMYEGWNQGEKI